MPADPFAQMAALGTPVAAPAASAAPATAAPAGVVPGAGGAAPAADPNAQMAALGTPVAAPSSASRAAPSAPPETIGRAAGLGLRALWGGAGQLIGGTDSLIKRGVGAVGPVLSDVAHGNFSGAGDEIKHVFEGPGAQPYKGPELSDLVHPSRWADAAQYFANKAGLPTPATPGERIASAAVSMLPGLAMMPEDPEAAGADAGLLSRAWQTAKVAAPLMGSGAASQFAKEEGASPGEQLAAGLIVGGLPVLGAGGAAAIRGFTRGGEDGAALTAARIADAKAAGTTLTAGQATGSRTLQAVEGASSKLWGGAALNKLLESQDEHAGNTVRQIADNLAGHEEATPTTAGEAIKAGAKVAKQSARAAEEAAYDRVAALIHPATPVDVSSTIGKLNELATPTPGAETTTAALIPKEISALRDNLTADAGTTGTIPYKAARALRTRLGNSIDWGFAPSDPVRNGAFKQAYGALTGDLNAAASTQGPEATQAVAVANALHQSNVAQSELLDSIVNRNGGPEAVYNAALSGSKAGATKIRAAMLGMNPEQRNLFQATVIGKLGLVPSGIQGAEGNVFRLNSFLTHWNNLSAEAKDALFGASGPSGTVRSALDSVARAAADIRGNTLLKNPSGTGQAMGHALTLWDALEGLGEGGLALLHHAGAGIGAVAGNWTLARLLSKPWFASWLANSTRLPASALPVALAALQHASIRRNSQDGLAVSHALASRIAQGKR